MVYGVFAFTGYYSQALNFAAVNRALLHIAPATVFVCFLQVPALFAQDREDATPRADPAKPLASRE